MSFWRGVALGTVLGASVASACPTCGSPDPTTSSVSVAEGQPFEVRMRAAAEASVGADARGTGADALQRSDLRLSAAVAYAPTPTVTLIADLPVIWRTARFVGSPPLQLTALGDVELDLRWRLFRDRTLGPRQIVFLNAGAALPSSPMGRAPDGAPFDWRVQIGTGAVQPLVGASYLYALERGSLFGAVEARWPTEGWLGVRPGRSVRSSVGGQGQLGKSVALRLAVDLRLDEAWRAQGLTDPDSGGFICYATPELRVAPRKDLTLALSLREPLVEALRGTQVHGTLYRLAVTWEL